jgi:hypothetical protein
MQTEGDNAGVELAESKYIRHPKEEGADRLADLVNKGAIFDIFYTHSRVKFKPSLNLCIVNY